MPFRYAAFLAALLAPTLGLAETSVSAQLSIELNASQTVENGCKLSFLVVNGHDTNVSKVVYEAVLFDASGQVNNLMLFDFGELPAKRPRVRQFVVGGLQCENLGQVLVNGVNTCEGADLPDGSCSIGLQLGTRTTIEVVG